jgi:hypothetical protein
MSTTTHHSRCGTRLRPVERQDDRSTLLSLGRRPEDYDLCPRCQVLVAR